MDDIKVFYNSHHLFYRNPFGAVPCGSKIFFRVEVEGCEEINLELIHFSGARETIIMKKIDKSLNNISEKSYAAKELIFSANKGSSSRNKNPFGEYFQSEIQVEEPGIIEYYFSIRRGNQWFYYGNNDESLGGIGKVYNGNPKPYQITVYEDFKVPNWYKEGIIYQIFVDSFYPGAYKYEGCRNNNISYNDNISVEKNAFSNKAHDAVSVETHSNYRDSSTIALNRKKSSFIYGQWYDEPMYIKDSSGNIVRWAFYGGNLQGIIEKLDYLKNLGVTTIYLNPIFEATSVHKYDTGDYLKIDSMFGNDEKFKELCDTAREKDMKIILDGVFSHTGEDSVYFNKFGNYERIGAFQSKESPYYKWYKFKNYPNDYECWWGVKALPNVEELEPSYMDFIINSENSVISKWLRLGAMGWRLDVADELPDAFIEALKKKVKEIKQEGIVIGEVWEDASNKVSYGQRRKYLLGKELDSIMNYPFRNLTLDFLRGIINSYDFVKRIMSLYENYPREVFYANMNLLGTHDTERLLTMFLDHNKNEQVAIALLKLATLLQMTFPGVPCIYYGDEAGLTGGKDPYNRKAYPWNRENKEILNWYKTITSIRSSYEVFKKGDIRFYEVAQEALCFERFHEHQRAVIMINRSISETVTIELDFKVEPLTFEDIIKKKAVVTNNGILKVHLKPLEFTVLISKT